VLQLGHGFFSVESWIPM